MFSEVSFYGERSGSRPEGSAFRGSGVCLRGKVYMPPVWEKRLPPG